MGDLLHPLMESLLLICVPSLCGWRTARQWYGGESF
jgi:hypothetical protein